MKRNSVWLPPPDELGPAPPPPGETEVKIVIKETKKEKPEMLILEELPIIKNNVSLFESQLQFITNVKGKIKKENITIGAHAKDLRRWKIKIEDHIETNPPNTNHLADVRLFNYLKNINDRICTCLIRYKEWESSLESMEQNSSETHNKQGKNHHSPNGKNIENLGSISTENEEQENTKHKQQSTSWGACATPDSTRKKRGNSWLGQARESIVFDKSQENVQDVDTLVKELELDEADTDEMKAELNTLQIDLKKKEEEEEEDDIEIFYYGEESEEKLEIKGECSICWEDMTDSTSKESREIMLLCGHCFCFKCLHSLCLMSTYDPSLILELGCPWQDCDHIIDESEVRFLVDPGTFQDYERNHFLAVKQKDPLTRFCPVPGCSALIDTEVPSLPHIICPSCRAEYCFYCMRSWHGPNVTCEESKKKEKELEPDSASIQFEEWVEKNNAKSCPNCKIMIEKVSGCNHMTCKSCSFAFCWICLEKYESAHYTTGPCAGKQFYGVSYSYNTNYAPTDPGNQFVLPPPFFRSKIQLNRSSKIYNSHKKKKRRLLKLPPLFNRSHSKNRPFSLGSSSNANNNVIKICLLGDSGVGKSPFVIQFCSNHFVEEYDPTIEDSYRKQLIIGETAYLLDILDTCGMEEYAAMRDQWIRGSEAFMIMFSCISRYSVDALSSILEQVVRVKDADSLAHLPIVIVGTKYDLDQSYDFDLERLQEITTNAGATLIFTSARFRINVDETFEEITKLVLEKRAREQENATS